jgi:hypothetical protein
MIHACGKRGCDVVTMGEFCVEHEQALTRNDMSLLEALTREVISAADQGVPAGATAAQAAYQRGRGEMRVPPVEMAEARPG